MKPSRNTGAAPAEMAPAEAVPSREWTGSMLSVIGAGGLAVIVNLASQVIRNKVLAVLLGPPGMGLWSLVQAIGSMLSAFCFLGLSGGVPTLISRRWSHGDEGGARSLLASSGVLVLVASTLPILLLGPFSGRLAEAWLGSSELWWMLVLVLVVNPVVNLGLLLAAALQGFFLVRSQVILGISTYVVVTIGCVVGAVVGDARGASIGWVLAGVWGPACALILLRSKLSPIGRARRRWPRWSDIRRHARELMPYSVSALTASGVATAASLLLRAFLLGQFGLGSVGFYATATGISATALFMIQNTINMYAVPRAAALADKPEEMWQLLHRVGRLVAVITFPVLLAEVLFAERIITVLFTDEFVEAAPLLKIFAVGDVFQMVAWMFVSACIAQRAPYVVLVARVAEAVTLVAVALLLMPSIGILGAAWAYLAAAGVALTVLFAARGRQAIAAGVPWRRSVAVWGTTLAAVVLGTAGGPAAVIAGVSLAGILAWVAGNPADRERFMELVRSFQRNR